jgi:hypothetical protein
MDQKPKRKLHTKEHFLEGNRQKWLIVFLLCGGLILGLDAAHFIQKVDSYLTFLTFLSGSFILGYSGTETMKLFRVSSESVNENITETTRTEIKEEIITKNAKEEDYKVE